MKSTEEHLPLKPRIFEILLALLRGDDHGYAIIQELNRSSRTRILPGSFYRDLESIEAAEMIEEVDSPPGTAGRKRCFRITSFGRTVVRAEARRMEQLAQVGTELLQQSRGES
ncbi:MAG: PadR family transcriptional regulator [Acidobacteria bacterium]|nr:PadR family transcriptional regulator [Acidobacteriota bacterium]